MLDEIGWRIIAKLPVQPDLLELIVKGIRLFQVQRIAELSNQISGLHQPSLSVRRALFSLRAGGKARELDRACHPCRVDPRRSSKPLHREELRPVHVIRG